MQIYGSGEQSTLSAKKKSALRDAEEKEGDYQNMSCIGPFYHSDKH